MSPERASVAPFIASRRTNSALWRWLVLLILLLVVVAWSLSWGAPVPLHDLWSSDTQKHEIARLIFMQLRPPRVLAGLLVGANLALSGAALQSAFRNPLAEPYLLGTSAGGALGAAIALWWQPQIPFVGEIGAVSLLAFAGALAASALISALGRSRSQNAWSAQSFDSSGLLLCGVAVSSLLGALMSLFVVLSPRVELAQQITFWLLGGLSGATWTHNALLFFTASIGALLMFRSGRDMDAARLGEEEALALGVDLKTLHRRLLIAAALMSAMAVATAGLIGFVGLLAPHLMRLMFGIQTRMVVPAAIMGGAILLCACDTLARSVASPLEIPVGIFTALLGVPLFIWLLRRV